VAVGILVDDATVAIENIHATWSRAKRWKRHSGWRARNRFAGVRLYALYLHRFVPMFFLTGVAQLSVRSVGGKPLCSPCSRVI